MPRGLPRTATADVIGMSIEVMHIETGDFAKAAGGRIANGVLVGAEGCREPHDPVIVNLLPLAVKFGTKTVGVAAEEASAARTEQIAPHKPDGA
ncbi:MAG: hypothetical protein JO058_22790 [Alphaproteobacteria bacterium]|nr:hypothetical protein [Alphaproteobacteria bacterium]